MHTYTTYLSLSRPGTRHNCMDQGGGEAADQCSAVEEKIIMNGKHLDPFSSNRIWQTETMNFVIHDLNKLNAEEYFCSAENIVGTRKSDISPYPACIYKGPRGFDRA